MGITPGVAAYAERVYAIRNQLVHQQDYDSTKSVPIDPSAWPVIAVYLCELLRLLYSTFAADLGYRFEI